MVKIWGFLGAGAGVLVLQIVFVCVFVRPNLHDAYTIFLAITSPHPVDHNWESAMSGYTVDEYFNRAKCTAWFMLLADVIWKVMTIFGATNYWIAMGIVNIIIIDVAIVFAVLIAREIGGQNCAIWATIFCVFFFGFNPLILQVYTNVYIAPFVTAGVWLCFRIFRAQRKMPIAIGLGALFGIGYLIKGHIISIIIALLIIVIAYVVKNRAQFRRVGVLCLAGFAMFGVILGIGEGLIYAQNIWEYKPNRFSPPLLGRPRDLRPLWAKYPRISGHTTGQQHKRTKRILHETFFRKIGRAQSV